VDRSSREGDRGEGRAHRLTLIALAGSCTLLALSLLIGAASFYSMWQARANWEIDSSGAPLTVFDPAIGFVSPPGATTVRRHLHGVEYSYHRDARGARVGSPDASRPVRVDLVFVGGSFTLGRGVEHEESFPALAARDLGLSAANLGIGAYGTVQSLLLLERNADLARSVVVYGFIEPHLRRNLSACAPSYSPHCVHVPYVDFDDDGRPFLCPPSPGAAADWARNERFHAALPAHPIGPASLRAGLDLLLRPLRSGAPPGPPRDARRDEASMRLLLPRMSEAAARGGGRLVVVYIPDLRDPGRPLPPALAAALPPGATLVDVSAWLRARPASEPLVLPGGDDHPSPAGHRAIAAALAAGLRR